jgi:outer membrane protein assembly factor BamB
MAFLLFLMVAAIGFSQQATVSSVSFSPSTVAGGTTVTGTVTLASAPQDGAVVVSLSSTNSNVTVPASVSVTANSTSATFSATTSATTTSYTSSITASVGTSSASTTLTVVENGISAFTVSATSITAGDAITGTITLLAPAGTGGWKVNLSDSNTNDTLPASVTVASGATSASFYIHSNYNATATYSDTFVGTDAFTTASSPVVAIRAETISGFTYSTGVPYVKAGNSLTATITLSYYAPTGGWKVNLSSSDTTKVTVPASVTVPFNSRTATFSVTSVAGTSGPVTITGTDQNSTKSSTLTLLQYTGIASVAMSPNVMTSSDSSTGTVTLLYAAPSQGWTVNLSTTSSSDTVPASITIPSGATSATFTLTSATSRTSYKDTVTASDVQTTGSTVITVYAEYITGLSVNPATVKGGTSATGSITLFQPAPSSGWTVNLSSSNSAATVPATVTVPSGATTATFTIATTLPASTASSVITTSDIHETKTQSLIIQGPFAQGLVLTPSVVTPSQSSTGTVSIDIAAPPGGEQIPLASSSSEVIVPSTVTVAAGAKSATFPVTLVSNAAPTSATITATINSSSTSATLTVRASHTKWHFNAGNPVTSTAAVSNLGVIMFGTGSSTSGVLDALTSSGTLTWSDGPYSTPASSPVLDSNHNVYVAAGPTVYSYTPKGVLLWSVTPDAGNNLTSSLTLAGSTLYVGCADKKLYAISTGGTVSWSYTTGGSIVSKPAVDGSGNVYFGSMDDYIYSLTSSGAFRFSHNTLSPVTANPAVTSSGTVYIGSQNKKFYALNSTGLLWYFTTAGEVEGGATIGSDGTIYFGSDDKNLYALNSNGTLKWGFSTGGSVLSTPLVSSAGTIYFGSMDGNMYAVNAAGNLVWSQLVTSLGVQGSAVMDSNGYFDIGSNDGYFTAFLP